MKYIALRLAVLGCLAPLALSSTPVFADVTADLKAEIEAQRAQLEAQRAQLEAQRQKLEALEKKLDAVAVQSTTAEKVAQEAASKSAAREAASKSATQQASAASSIKSLLATGPNWQPGFTFQLTPADTVTLYGLIDATISDISNANANGAHKRSTQTAWFSGNRWGVTGHHSFDNSSLRMIFKLESEFDYQTGEEDTPGVLFNRDAWVGVESDTLGKLTIGRQNALARDFTGIYGDPFNVPRVTTGEGGYTNVNNFKQLIYYAASATGTRYDRGVVWKKEFGPFVAGLGYQFGGVAGDFSKGSTKTVAFGYNGPDDLFHLAGFFNDFNVNGLTHKAWSVGGNVAAGPIVRVHGGYYKYDSEQGGGVGNRKDHAWTVSTKIAPSGPLDYELGYQIIHAENAGVNASGFVLIPYADALGVTKTATGDKKTLYGAIFYHLDKRAELYLAADYMKLVDGYKLAVTNGHATQTEVAVGVRFRF